MLTIKSDDVIGRVAAYEAIVRGQEFKSPNIPASFYVLINELKSMALDVELLGVKEPVKEKKAEEKTINKEIAATFNEVAKEE